MVRNDKIMLSSEHQILKSGQVLKLSLHENKRGAPSFVNKIWSGGSVMPAVILNLLVSCTVISGRIFLYLVKKLIVSVIILTGPSKVL